MSARQAPRQRGLTLVELLLALSLSAGLGLLSYRALALLVDSREQVARANQRWRDIALFFNRLEVDLLQCVPREVSPGDRRNRPGLMARDGEALVMTRFRGDRSGVERVTYRLVNQTLFLAEEDELAAPGVPAAAGDPLLAGVRGWRVEFLGQALPWVPEWPVEPGSSALPRAVRLTLDVDGAGTLSRVFALR